MKSEAGNIIMIWNKHESFLKTNKTGWLCSNDTNWDIIVFGDSDYRLYYKNIWQGTFSCLNSAQDAAIDIMEGK